MAYVPVFVVDDAGRPAFVYHGTSAAFITEIKKTGLKPQVAEASPRALVYFTEDEAGAEEFGDIVLRFPPPKDEVTIRFYDDHEAQAFGATPSTIPTRYIEVRQGRRWVPLRDA